ncbi:hypothetical protein AB2F98_01580 [Escherichia coli]
MVARTRIDDDHVFMDNEFLFGASARRTAKLRPPLSHRGKRRI